MKHAKLTMRELIKRLNYCWRSFFLPIFSPGANECKHQRMIDPCDINAIKADKMRRAMEEDND